MKRTFTEEDVIHALFILACRGASENFNIDLAEAVEFVGEFPPIDALLMFAGFAAETEGEKELVRRCESIVVKSKGAGSSDLTPTTLRSKLL